MNGWTLVKLWILALVLLGMSGASPDTLGKMCIAYLGGSLFYALVVGIRMVSHRVHRDLARSRRRGPYSDS
jgi:hypothetical protein